MSICRVRLSNTSTALMFPKSEEQILVIKHVSICFWQLDPWHLLMHRKGILLWQSDNAFISSDVVMYDNWRWFVSESSTDVSTKLISEASCIGGRLSHNEEERYIAVMKELQFGEPLKSVLSFCLSYFMWKIQRVLALFR